MISNSSLQQIKLHHHSQLAREALGVGHETQLLLSHRDMGPPCSSRGRVTAAAATTAIAADAAWKFHNDDEEEWEVGGKLALGHASKLASHPLGIWARGAIASMNGGTDNPIV